MLQTIPLPIRDALRGLMEPASLKSFSPVSGGCINHGGKLTTSDGRYFIKWNDRDAFPSMFDTEARGLRLLASTHSVRVNAVKDVGESGKFQFIILEWIESTRRSPEYWTLLGKGLSDQHRHSNSTFGLDQNNYIGSLHQSNQPTKSWGEFFIQHRLEPQIKLATENHHPIMVLRKKMDLFYKKVLSLMPEEPPALLHGDLWGGNLIVDEKGNPCLIDPAVYYGHREAELAYTQLMSRFDIEFYRSYEESYPLQPGFSERADLYNLYPLLVHVNLFGGGYVQQSEAVVNRFV